MWPITATTNATAANVWPIWVSNVYANQTSTTTNVISTGTGAGTATQIVWRTWVSNIYAGTSETESTGNTSTAWQNWVTTVYANQTASATNTIRTAPPAAPSLSPEQRAQAEADRRRREEEWRQRDEAARRERAQAEEKALRLLVAVLSDVQRKELAADGCFHVDAPSGRRYRIEKGRSGNVYVVDKVTGSWTEKLCIHQREDVPVYDTMAIQKLLIESAEDVFRSTANITHRTGGYTYGQGTLDGHRLGQVLPFRQREERAAA